MYDNYDSEVICFFRFITFFIMAANIAVKRSKNPDVAKVGFDLTVHQYSCLLHDAMSKYQDLHEDPNGMPLMNLCFDMAFYVTLPNQGTEQRDTHRYFEIICQFCHPVIAQVISSFLQYKDDWVKWVKLDEDETESELMSQVLAY